MTSPGVVGSIVTALFLLSIVILERAMSARSQAVVRERLIPIAEGSGSLTLRLPEVRTPVLAGVAWGVAGFLIDGVVLGGLFAYLALSTSAYAKSRRERRLISAYNRDVPVVFDAIALSLQSGATVVQALVEATEHLSGPVTDDLREVVRQVNCGVPFGEAISGWRTKRQVTSVQLAAAAISLAHDSGGSAVRAVTTVRASVRAAIAVDANVQAFASQARASAMVLAAMPFVLSGPMLWQSEVARQFMFHNAVGISFLTAGVALNATGLRWMSSMIDGARS